MNAPQFKVLFDGECPFCRQEVKLMDWMNRAKRLGFEDIAAPEFDPGKYGSTLDQLMGEIHGVHADGRVIKGMEVFRQAYRAIGLGWLAAPTGWPGLRIIFDAGYRIFARYRVRLGNLFGRSCVSDRCAVK